MPSTSPGNASITPSSFLQILPGASCNSLQSTTTFIFRHKRYVVYISGTQLNILSAPRVLLQALTFNEDLVAVAAEKQTGKIVVASKSEVWVLEPVTEGWTKVWWEKTLFLLRDDPGDEAHGLSWGTDGEILIGGSRQLSLFSTLPSSRTSAAPSLGGTESTEERRILWSKGLPSPVQHVTFSPSATLIATCGPRDRLVKIWRRLSFEEGLFDYNYLSHPGAVTHVEWRPLDEHADERRASGINGRQDDDPEVLYTVSNDGILRVWRTGGIHDLNILVLHTTVDLISAIPESPSLSTNRKTRATNNAARYISILPSDQFCAAVTAAIGFKTAEKLSNALEHLKEAASKEPDIVVSFDGRGRMSAWGLQSIGHKRRPETPTESAKLAYHVAHAENLPLKIEEGLNAGLDTWFDDDRLNLITHTFDGKMRWWQGDVERVFSPSVPGPERMNEVAYWSGHISGPVGTLRCSEAGTELVSSDSQGEVIAWGSGHHAEVEKISDFRCPNKILDIGLLSSIDGAKKAVVLLELSGSNLDLVLRTSTGHELQQTRLDIHHINESEQWRLFTSHDPANANTRVVVINNCGKGFASVGNSSTGFEKAASFSVLCASQDQVLLHSVAVLDALQPEKLGLVCITKPGSLLLYHSQAGAVDSEPHLVAKFDSGISDSSIFAANNHFAAVVSSTGDEMVILDLTDGYLEYRHTAEQKIKHIELASRHNLIAVGYDTSVDILAQGHYQHHGTTPTWILAKRVSMSQTGLTVNALAWMGDLSLAVAAGNGIYRSTGDVSIQELHADVQEAIVTDTTAHENVKLASLTQHLNESLPVWHPSLLSHPVRNGNWSLATDLVERLLQKLKFWSEGDYLHALLNMEAEDIYNPKISSDGKTLDKEIVQDLIQQLEEKKLPSISQSEQKRLKKILDVMMYCSEHIKGLDNGAVRFLFSWRLQSLEASSSSEKMRQVAPEMHWREIAFAYHSTTQQPLLDILIAHYDNKITWDIARQLGLFAWLSDKEALIQIFDGLAQSTYRATSPPDPINASLYFLALHKKQTLIALWRIASWHKEQRATMNFLRRDFSQNSNQTAARKNAYALMGKRRFDYAAAFFLLADDGPSATNVLAGQCGDVMLAIAVSRLYSGDSSSVVRKLLQERLIPEGVRTGNRWLLCWCHSLLSEKDLAAEVLIHPLDGVRTWHQDDPNTLTLYRQLRSANSEYEYEAVLRAARILRRMGLWLPALELVRQWDFKSATPLSKDVVVNGIGDKLKAADEALKGDAPSMLDDFNPPDEKSIREAKAAELLKKMKEKKAASQVPIVEEKKPTPTQFKEPDASSLLDNFGF